VHSRLGICSAGALIVHDLNIYFSDHGDPCLLLFLRFGSTDVEQLKTSKRQPMESCTCVGYEGKCLNISWNNRSLRFLFVRLALMAFVVATTVFDLDENDCYVITIIKPKIVDMAIILFESFDDLTPAYLVLSSNSHALPCHRCRESILC
jgi:hypothetical protein